MDIGLFFISVVAGLLGTFAMDVGSALGSRVGLLKPPSAALLGRWVAYLIRGKLVHRTIFDANPVKHESLIGIASHYGIGVALGILYFWLAAQLAFSPADILTAIAYGTMTDVFPFLLMFPAMGFGFFALKAPPGAPLFRTAIWNHLVYGLTLGVVALFTSGGG
ncbi:MAG: hypothetical protein A2X94_00490 [Bdellovibrionales bacterium GWB1_55_8]|nr:MAG: hypothetical protein A2X94_00490 [Bdellovibrionales bacterium GWB1_55_8]